MTQEAANQDYDAAYYAKALLDKIAARTIRARKETLLMVLTLYYCLLDPVDPDTLAAAKAIITGALGYFIVPADVIPEVVPAVGYSHDIGVPALAVATALLRTVFVLNNAMLRQISHEIGPQRYGPVLDRLTQDNLDNSERVGIGLPRIIDDVRVFLRKKVEVAPSD